MERRSIKSNYRAEGNKLFGYAAIWNSATVIKENGKTFTESIRRGAFSRSLADSADILCTYNHNPDSLLGRLSSKTLSIREDNTGLLFEVELPDSPTGQEVRALVARGDLSGASFTFAVPQGGDKWSGSNRELVDIDLYECGPVVSPAYESTVIGLRSKQNYNYYAAKAKLLEMEIVLHR